MLVYLHRYIWAVMALVSLFFFCYTLEIGFFNFDEVFNPVFQFVLPWVFTEIGKSS